MLTLNPWPDCLLLVCLKLFLRLTFLDLRDTWSAFIAWSRMSFGAPALGLMPAFGYIRSWFLVHASDDLAYLFLIGEADSCLDLLDFFL